MFGSDGFCSPAVPLAWTVKLRPSGAGDFAHNTIKKGEGGAGGGGGGGGRGGVYTKESTDLGSMERSHIYKKLNSKQEPNWSQSSRRILRNSSCYYQDIWLLLGLFCASVLHKQTLMVESFPLEMELRKPKCCLQNCGGSLSAQS